MDTEDEEQRANIKPPNANRALIILTIVALTPILLVSAVSYRQDQILKEKVAKRAADIKLHYPTPTATTPPTIAPTKKPTAKRPTVVREKTTTNQTTEDYLGPDVEWGKAIKKADGSYTMKIQLDKQMATPNEIYQALNSYRQSKGKGNLAWDDRLAGYATERADHTCKNGIDNHAGFKDFLSNQDGFNKLGFGHLGENMGNMRLSGVHLIEWMYSQSPGHDANQLGDWSHVGIGVVGDCDVLVFGGQKL